MENSSTYNSELHPITYRLKLMRKNLSSIIGNREKNSRLRKKLLFVKYAFTGLNSDKSGNALILKKQKLFFKLEETVKENNEYFIYYKGKSKIYVTNKGKYKIYLGKGRKKNFTIKYRNLNNIFHKKSNKFIKKNIIGTGFENQLSYYNTINKLTKYNIHKFIASLHNNLAFIGKASQKNNNIMLPAMKNLSLLNLDKNIEINLKNLSKHVFKYKIYNNNIQYLNNDINNHISIIFTYFSEKSFLYTRVFIKKT